MDDSIAVFGCSLFNVLESKELLLVGFCFELSLLFIELLLVELSLLSSLSIWKIDICSLDLSRLSFVSMVKLLDFDSVFSSETLSNDKDLMVSGFKLYDEVLRLNKIK